MTELGSKIGAQVTEAELMGLPDDGHLYELVDGLVAGKPAGSVLAGAVAANLVCLLGLYTRGRGAMTIGKAGFRMTNGNIRVPSISYTRKARLPGGKVPNTFGDVAPDLCVEIISPSERQDDMDRKVREYFEAGAVFVWHVFPETQRVTVFTSPTDTNTYGPDDTLDVGDLLPGFSCRVSDLVRAE